MIYLICKYTHGPVEELFLNIAGIACMYEQAFIWARP